MMTSTRARGPFIGGLRPRPSRPSPRRGASGSPVLLELQRTAGNAAVVGLLAGEQGHGRAAAGEGSSLQRTAAAPPSSDLTLVRSMISKGRTDENGLTNAVFYARHPGLAGQPLTKGSPLAKEWVEIRTQVVRPALSAPTPTYAPAASAEAAAPTSTAAAAAAPTPASSATTTEEPGLLQHGWEVLSSVATSAYDAVAGWVSGDDETTPATPGATPPPAMASTAPTTTAGAPPVAPPTTSTTSTATAGSPTTSQGELRFHTIAPTIEGGTLDIAKTRADLGDEGTTYDRSASGLSNIMSGSTDASTFWCSGLSLWTLAAAGYDLSKTIVGEDGKPYTYTKVTIKKKNGEDVEKETEVTITLKQLVDGEPPAVEAMALAEQQGMKNGGSVGRLSGRGHSVGYTAGGVADSVKGAAGAFKLARIGAEVDELDQKPGDFAQSRYENAVDGDTEVRHRGFGHAWQVWAVRVTGSALFGEKGSPTPKTAGLKGWHDGVEFVIDKDTDPSLVGAHTVAKASRIEANIAGAGTLTKTSKGGDGGVAITREWTVPDTGSGKTGWHLFYGRLGTSRWANWEPAKKPA